MTDHRRRRRLAGRGLTAVCLTMLLALTGCGVMPTTPGEVRAGDPVEETVTGDVALLPNDPIPDSTPEQIVQDFIQAAVSPAGDWSIARKFLSPDVTTWEPGALVMIDQRDREVSVGEPADDGTVTVDVATAWTGIVDDTGVYTELNNEAHPLSYTLVQVDGQWRIQKAPPGILIEQGLFAETVYNRYALTFWDPTYTYLVSDLRWFPRALAPTRIVRALIAGPSPALLPAVENAFPSGMRVSEGLTQVENRVASVAVTDLQGADSVAVSRMQAQLLASMQVRQVVLSIDGVPVAESPAQPAGTSVDTRAVVLDTDGFGRLNGGAVNDLPGLSAPLSVLRPVSIDLAVSRGLAAVLDEGGRVLRVSAEDTQPALLDERAGLIAPTIDPEGEIWSVPTGAPRELVRFGPDGDPVPVENSLGELTSVQAMQISRDGTRLALAATRDREQVLGYAPIVRDANGTPTGVGSFTELQVLTGPALDIAWLDDLTIGVLVDDPQGRLLVDKVIGGASERVPVPAGAFQLAGANSAATARVLTTDGVLYTRRASQWTEEAEGVLVVATQTATATVTE